VTTQQPTHDCPGGCGTQVAYHLFACRSCWRRLPAVLRTPITESWRKKDHRAHRAAMLDARDWYKANPLLTGGAA